jgi:hypothetical protein
MIEAPSMEETKVGEGEGGGTSRERCWVWESVEGAWVVVIEGISRKWEEDMRTVVQEEARGGVEVHTDQVFFGVLTSWAHCLAQQRYLSWRLKYSNWFAGRVYCLLV